ncbi:MAG: hypothetical protein H6602_12460 [Flavobacteriales bacterium]|nr:hypothetical protein [Flavobacteriales bacterium]
MVTLLVNGSLKTDIFGRFKSVPNVTRKAGNPMGLKLRFFLYSLLILSSLTSMGQVSFENEQELEKAANEFFESRQYDKAKPLFSQLLSLNALDPDYNYRFGVCILYTESDPLKPLPYIEGGANSEGVNKEAYYFLGKAYQFNYRFDDAINYFEKAKKSGFSASGIDIDKSIEECRNGKLYVGNLDFQPAQDKEVIESEFYRPYDFRKLKGKVIPMPPSFKTKYDEKNLTGTVVYTPTNSQTLFFASYGEDGANGKDLYKVNRLPNGEWAMPQRLPDVINSKYDEDFAVFDEEELTLFFASKGRYSMGGYDVFKSQYSPDDDSWSQPINLRYPINSPYDDFLYVSDPDGKIAFFTSGRESEMGKLRVFKTLLYDPSQVELSIVEGTYEDRTDSVFNYMLATVLDPKTNEVVGKYRSNKETGKYVLLLPPQNDYKLDVGPNEASGFQFDLDVPEHEVTKPLQQSIVYDANSVDGTVTLTNYFSATGDQDSVALAANRPKAEVDQAMVAMPDREQILAAKANAEKQAAKEKEGRLAELAAKEEAKLLAELARTDSIRAVKRAALEAEALKLKAEAAKRDSIAKAELALKEKLEREKAIVDSLALVEQKLAAEREKLEADSLAKVAEAQMLAEKQKAEEESLAIISNASDKEAELARQRAVNDSIAAVERAALEAQFLAERKKAEEDSLAIIALAKEAELTRQRAVNDSISAVERAALEAQFLAEKKKAEEDSLAIIALAKEAELARQRAVNDSIAAVERAAFEAQLLAEKEKAKQDSASAATLAQESAVEATFDDLLKEMQEKEAEILASQEKESSAEEVAEVEEVNAPVANEVVAETDTAETEKLISEADLFLQTLADIEAQKQAQAEEVEKENARLAQERAAKQESQKTDIGSLASADSVKVNETEVAAMDSTLVQAVTESEKAEMQPAALKSDADPEEYLAALAEMEAEMAKADAENKKTYELVELDPIQTDSKESSDPKLQQMLDADRKALEEHKRIAAEKEKVLQEQLARDKEVLAVVVEESEKDELAAIEAEMLQDLEHKKQGSKFDLGSEKIATDSVSSPMEAESKEAVAQVEVISEEVAETETDEALIAEADEVVSELSGAVEPEQKPEEITPEMEKEVASESIEETQPKIAETTTEEIVESEILEDVEADLIAEADEVVSELSEAVEPEKKLEEAAPEMEKEVDSESMEETQPEIAETTTEEAVESEVGKKGEADLIAEADEVISEVISEEESKPEAEELIEEATEKAEDTEEVTQAETEQVVEEVELAEAETTLPETTEQPKTSEPVVNELMVSESGQRIPFLQPAKRDYSYRPKPDFNSIENVSMRRMVQRMRAEDIGRLAVLKNMKNQWIEEGKTQESLQEIKENRRNQDVLTNLVEPVGREEKIREPFDQNDLRTREGVYYQLGFKLATPNVSETIQEAMSPEQAMTFAMPEFKITSDHFSNLADARAEMRYYRQRGFDNVEVIAYLNGDKIMLSDAENIPFID